MYSDTINSKMSPPNPPWIAIPLCKSSGGYLSYYYSDDLSVLPVRAVTMVNDNKVDPNLETKSYGLFSPCNKIMRKSIVKRGCPYIFFITNRGGRVLSGIYFVKWFASLSPENDDFCLAADKVWFVKYPIPLVEVDKACGTNVSRPFRNCLRVTFEESKKILSLLGRKPNATELYLSEISRLERFNLKHTGYRYPSGLIECPYSWNCEKTNIILRKCFGN